MTKKREKSKEVAGRKRWKGSGKAVVQCCAAVMIVEFTGGGNGGNGVMMVGPTESSMEATYNLSCGVFKANSQS